MDWTKVGVILAVIGIAVSIYLGMQFFKGPTVELNYCTICDDTFKGHIEAKDLKKDRDYVLCINGKPNGPGNEILMKFDKHKENGEWVGHWDFDYVRSDGFGSLSTDFEAKNHLQEGTYDAKFLIKEYPSYKRVAAYDSLNFGIHRNNITEEYNQPVPLKPL